MRDTSKDEHSGDVRRMFSRIAGRYDLMNHLLSANMDVLWRRKAVKECGPGDRVLDLCMGSGDMALAWVKKYRNGKVFGLDFCRDLLEKVDKKSGGDPRVVLIEGDALKIPFQDNTFDAVMCAFGLRNLADAEQGMREIRRVMKPGGRCVILDFFRPRSFIPRAFYATYARYFIPMAARLFAEDYEAYKYLHRSVRKFLSLDEFNSLLVKVGFRDIRQAKLTAGVACMVSAGL